MDLVEKYRKAIDVINNPTIDPDKMIMVNFLEFERMNQALSNAYDLIYNLSRKEDFQRKPFPRNHRKIKPRDLETMLTVTSVFDHREIEFLWEAIEEFYERLGITHGN